MKKQATIFDYARICKQSTKCSQCLLRKFCADQRDMFSNDIDEANEIILKWCEEHPVKTRQDKFLEIYPNAATQNGSIAICPKTIDETAKCGPGVGSGLCSDCKRDYWLAEVDE